MIDLKGINNIIFDFGGVIININPKFTIESLKRIGIYNAERLFTDLNINNALHKLELGKWSSFEFLLFLKQHCQKEVTFHQITEAWNAMLLDIPIERIKLLLDLKKKYKLFLLSNTNDIHYKHFQKTFLTANNGIPFQQFFDKAYFSFEIKLRKPSIEVFKFVINDQNIKPNETLFIDDSIENIETAKMLGLKTHWLTNELVKNFEAIKV